MRAIILVLLVSTGLGCANANDLIGAAYLTQTTIANSVADECGNTAPGGPCVATSAIDTGLKEDIKRMLEQADRYTDDAARLAAAGNRSDALSRLELATNLLDELEQILIERGIE